MDDFNIAGSQSYVNIGGLGLEILQEGGTPAEAMQSMLMSVVLADYQRSVFTEVPNGTTSSTAALRSFFITTQVPGGNGRTTANPAGATRSGAVLVILVLFITSTKNTLIWESWHMIAQSISAVTEPYLNQATLATDAGIKKQMKIDGTFGQAVFIRADDSGVRAKVGVVRQRSKSTRVQKDSRSGLLMEELRSFEKCRKIDT
ncbi:hypothetical protein GGP41_002296 [Bipolaris sorokiniana]|uniref:Uncharacterized protein n=1 Tax=Cochliobolus sativus TaxID=45130 RepID=A0A8H6DW61_COCSA|nr:hypothetical protein GGP41_002296 [Bipolaris sorokiniana]